MWQMQSLGWEALILVTPILWASESLSVQGTAKELDSISRYPFQLKKLFFNVLEILTLKPEELAFRLSFSFAFKSQFLSLSFLINKKRKTYFALPGHVFENLNLEEKSLSLVWVYKTRIRPDC